MDKVQRPQFSREFNLCCQARKINMMMAHVAENLLNWVLSLILGAEVDASTLNCIREQLESQRRFECTEVLQKAGILCGLCGK